MLPSSKKNLLNLSLESLTDWVKKLGHKPFRARQLWQWIHQKGVSDFALMHNLAQDFRQELLQIATVTPPPILSIHRARDGCLKFLFDVGNHNVIESVLIPENDRLTLCLSTQVGCPMACVFCATGHQGFNRQLQLSEVVGQLWQINHYLAHREVGPLSRQRISNIVMMGMGEPLANYRVTIAALRIFLDDWAYGLSRRRITVSTVGLVGAIDRLAKDCPVSLALSLHAPNDKLRSQLMPVNHRYPLSQLLSACHRYLKVAPRSKIMIEYILLAGYNDTAECLQQLIALCQDIPCKINLIPFNHFPQSRFQAPSYENLKNFAHQLKMGSGRLVVIRRTRGDDVAGACGQLAGIVKDSRRQLAVPQEAFLKPSDKSHLIAVSLDNETRVT